MGALSSPANELIVQRVSAAIAAATGTTSIPDDNTAPLSTEGSQIASLVIAPKSASNKIRIRASLIAGVSTEADLDGGLVISCFRDGVLVGTKRLYFRATSGGAVSGGFAGDVCAEFEDAPASTSALTYSLRIGVLGNPSSWFVNRSPTSSTALASSMANSRMTLEEVKP